MKYITLDPGEQDTANNYKLLIGSVIPRPIALVSTCNMVGQDNVAPFSFYTAVCSNPPTVLFCPTVRGSDGECKDTLRNIYEMGEFVINVVSEELVERVNRTAAELPYGVSEFEFAGLSTAPSIRVKPPRVAESPISMECRLDQVVKIGDGGIGSGNIVIGQVVQFHVREDVYDQTHLLTDKIRPVSRLAGSNYAPVREIFSLERPS